MVLATIMRGAADAAQAQATVLPSVSTTTSTDKPPGYGHRAPGKSTQDLENWLADLTYASSDQGRADSEYGPVDWVRPARPGKRTVGARGQAWALEAPLGSEERRHTNTTAQ